MTRHDAFLSTVQARLRVVLDYGLEKKGRREAELISYRASSGGSAAKEELLRGSCHVRLLSALYARERNWTVRYAFLHAWNNNMMNTKIAF